MVGKFDGVIFISFIDTPDSSYSELNGAPNHGSGIGGLNMYMRLGAVNTKYFNKGGHGKISDELFQELQAADNIYICGVRTESVVLATTLRLFDNDYSVFVIEDLCLSKSDELINPRITKIIKVAKPMQSSLSDRLWALRYHL